MDTSVKHLNESSLISITDPSLVQKLSLQRKSPIGIEIWSLPTNLFNVFCTDLSMKPDNHGYPLLPDGDCEWRFKHDCIPENSLKHYTEWAMERDNGKTKPAVNGLFIKYLKKKCLGVLVCADSNCPGKSRPKLEKSDGTKNQSTTCPVCSCEPFMIHLQCSADLTWYQASIDQTFSKFDLILRHNGNHTHLPPHVNKPDPISREALRKIVYDHPKRTPLQLSVGPNPIRNLHAAFGNVDRVAYYRREDLISAGLSFSSDGDGGIQSIILLQTQFGPNVVASSSLHIHDSHISIQTDFMRSRLIDNTELGRTTGGIQTDTTYSFFRNGYLLSSIVYCNLLKRFVPILFTWINRIDTDSHVPHFRCLIQTILKSIPDEIEQEKMIAQVVDYSNAQKEGFKKAYAQCKKGDNLTEKELMDYAGTLLKGCNEHFRESTRRLSRNHNIVPIGSDLRFNSLVTKMKTCETTSEFDEVVILLINEFPFSKNWVRWWISKSIAPMIFKVPHLYISLILVPYDNETRAL
jgi:hypothetical protein